MAFLPWRQPAVDSSQPVITPTRWIFDPKRDIALIVATPLLILPVAFAFLSVWSSAAFVLLVAAFGQLGHIFPSLMRADGDRELFRRCRTRFILTPLILGGICVASVHFGWHVTILVSVVWAIWHALMKTYGFLRIYAAKNQIPSAWNRRLDFLLCVGWFSGAILLNDQPLMLLVNHWYSSGGFLIAGWFISGVRVLWIAGLALITLAYAVQVFRQRREHGRRRCYVWLSWQAVLVFIGMHTPEPPTFWLAPRCSKSFTMCSTWPLFEVLIAGEPHPMTLAVS